MLNLRFKHQTDWQREKSTFFEWGSALNLQNGIVGQGLCELQDGTKWHKSNLVYYVEAYYRCISN